MLVQRSSGQPPRSERSRHVVDCLAGHWVSWAAAIPISGWTGTGQSIPFDRPARKLSAGLPLQARAIVCESNDAVRLRGQLRQQLDDLPNVSIGDGTLDVVEPAHESPPLLVFVECRRDLRRTGVRDERS